MVPMQTSNELINYILRQAALLGTSQFPYIIGVIFAKKSIYSKISDIFNRIKFKNMVSIFLIIVMIVAHGFVQSLFVAAFTGVAFIVLFNIVDKPVWIDNILVYLSKHSTNMWLIHMFFYMIYFKELVFAPKYPVLIFIWLILLCVGASHIINIIYKLTLNLIDSKSNKEKILV